MGVLHTHDCKSTHQSQSSVYWKLCSTAKVHLAWPDTAIRGVCWLLWWIHPNIIFRKTELQGFKAKTAPPTPKKAKQKNLELTFLSTNAKLNRSSTWFCMVPVTRRQVSLYLIPRAHKAFVVQSTKCMWSEILCHSYEFACIYFYNLMLAVSIWGHLTTHAWIPPYMV